MRAFSTLGGRALIASGGASAALAAAQPPARADAAAAPSTHRVVSYNVTNLVDQGVAMKSAIAPALTLGAASA